MASELHTVQTCGSICMIALPSMHRPVCKEFVQVRSIDTSNALTRYTQYTQSHYTQTQYTSKTIHVKRTNFNKTLNTIHDRHEKR